MCLLGLSSVLKGQVLSFYPDVGDFNHKHLFNCHITPRASSINQNCFRILFSRNEPFGTFVKSAKLQSYHFVTCYPQFRKERKVIQVTPVQFEKKSAWSYQKLKVLHLDLINVSNQNQNSNLTWYRSLSHQWFLSPLAQQYFFILIVSGYFNTSTLSTSSSSTVFSKLF